MSLALAFWIIILLWFVIGIGSAWYDPNKKSWPDFALPLVPFILFVLLGWKVFGAPLHG